MLGKKSTTLIPILPEKTEFFEAGSVSFGIEVRDLDDNIIDAAFAKDPQAQAAIEQMRAEGFSPNIKGFVGVHVLGADGLEYLRFDFIPDDPHYHYNRPQEHYNLYFQFDPVTGGDYIDWVFHQLRTNLPAMLKAAGAPASVMAGLDSPEVAEALSQAESAARAGLALQGSD